MTNLNILKREIKNMLEWHCIIIARWNKMDRIKGHCIIKGFFLALIISRPLGEKHESLINTLDCSFLSPRRRHFYYQVKLPYQEQKIEQRLSKERNCFFCHSICSFINWLIIVVSAEWLNWSWNWYVSWRKKRPRQSSDVLFGSSCAW